MFGVPLVRECTGNFWVASAHAYIFEMDSLGIRACRENKNNLEFVLSYRYLPLYSTITMGYNNPRILATIPSQWRRAS